MHNYLPAIVNTVLVIFFYYVYSIIIFASQLYQYWGKESTQKENYSNFYTIAENKWFFSTLLEAQLLSNYIDVVDSLTHPTGRLAVSAITSLIVDRFGFYLRVCHLEFDKKAISDGFMAHSCF